MSITDYLRALRAALSQRGRSALTLLGIAIGAGSIVLIASLMASGKGALIAANQEATESDLIQVQRERAPLADRHRTKRELSRADARVLADHPLLDDVAIESEATRQGEARFGSKTKRVRLVSARPSAPSIYRLELERGRFLDEDDLAARRRVCVVGHEVYEDLLGSATDLAPLRVTFHGEVFAVVGVLAPKPIIGNTTSTHIWDRKVLIPETTFDAVLAPSREADRIYVRGGPTTPVDGLRGIVEAVIARRHFGVKNFKVEDDSKRHEEEIIVTIIELLLASTGVLAMFVGGINVMNIMLVTVTERTREIGVRRAVGATRRSILVQFLVESGALALFGGLVGVAGGLALSLLAALALGTLTPSWSFELPLGAMALGLGLSLLTGIAFGAYPAWRAARTHPIVALRFD
jgi:putative ABC transport system permease protein